MNLKGFKKTHEDDDKATFSNKDGHLITVAKKGLSKKLLKDLGELPLHAAEGADVQSVQEPEFLSAYKDAKFSSQPEVPPAPTEEELAKQRMEKYGEEAMANEKQKQGLIDRGMIAPVQPENATEPVGEPHAPMAAAENPPMPMERQLTPEQKIQNHAMEKTKEDIAVANDLANGHMKYQEPDENGKIVAKTYHDLFAEKSTLGKIGTIFGLLLSGAGSGLAHQPNALLEMMNKEIDRDLESQKLSKENKLNFYKAHLQNELTKAQIQEHKISVEEKRLGMEKTKAMLGMIADLNATSSAKNGAMLGGVQYMQELVNKMPQGAQRQQAQIAVDSTRNAAYQQVQQNNLSAAQKSHEIQQNQDEAFSARQRKLRTAQMLGMEGAGAIAKEEADRYVPGIGMAKIPVPDKVRDEIIAHDKLGKAATDLLKYSKTHTNLIPGTPEYNVGKQKSLVLQQMVREGLLGTVFRESEKPLLKEFVDENPAGAFKMLSTQPKLKTLLESNKMAGDVIKESYGLPKSQEKQEPQQQERKFYNGKWYVRGENGKAVEVK